LNIFNNSYVVVGVEPLRNIFEWGREIKRLGATGTLDICLPHYELAFRNSWLFYCMCLLASTQCAKVVSRVCSLTDLVRWPHFTVGKHGLC